jgi:SAM-dependent methyltransferase
MKDDYSSVKGYQSIADLGLGCGLPTAFAKIHRGDTVLDLGSGAGNDCFVARHETGPKGKVIGVDFSDAMIQRARKNANQLHFNNVEFRSGDIEELPILDESIDVIVSNCVLNLVPQKARVMKEMYRVLRPGGHFSISDIVLLGTLPTPLREDAEMYAGCVSGAIEKGTYIDYLKQAGFHNIQVQKEKAIDLPDEVLLQHISPQEVSSFKKGNEGIVSISVYGEKPGEPSSHSKLTSDEIPITSSCC